MGSTVEHTWQDLIPDTTHNLVSLIMPTAGNKSYRAYQHSFNTGSSTSVNMFFKTSGFVADPTDAECVIGLYKANSPTNLLVGTANVSSVSSPPITHNTTTGIFSFSSNYTNTTATPNAVLTGLEANTTYYLISKTQWNDAQDINPASPIFIELGLALEVAGVNVPLKYESTRGLTPYASPHMIEYDTTRSVFPFGLDLYVSLLGTDTMVNPASPAKYTLKAGQTLTTTINGTTTSYVAGDAAPLYRTAHGKLRFAVGTNAANPSFVMNEMVGGVVELTLNSGVYLLTIAAPPLVDPPNVNPPPGPGPTSSFTPVTVNLGVGVDVSGNIVVFGQSAPLVNNIVVAAGTIPATSLFNGSNGLIEFWEPLYSIGEKNAALATTMGRNYKDLLPGLANGIQNVLNSSLNASTATPFSFGTYSPEYKTLDNFGKLALGSYAHYLFGHVQATAAITNDQAIMNAVLNMPGNPLAAFDGNAALWSTGTPTSANIARRLVNTLVTGDVSPTGNLLSIVKQVIGQDTARAKNNDATEGSPSRRQLLAFTPGDKIYFNIKLARPTLSVSNPLPPGPQPAGMPNPFTQFPTDNNVNYSIQVTLS
jgi:hypothetical protein